MSANDWKEQGFRPLGEAEPEEAPVTEKQIPDISEMVPVYDENNNFKGYALPEKKSVEFKDEIAELMDKAKGTIDTPETHQLLQEIGFVPETQTSSEPVLDPTADIDPDELNMNFEDDDDLEEPAEEVSPVKPVVEEVRPKIETAVSRKEEDWELILADDEFDDESEEFSEREKLLMSLPIIEYGVNEPIRNKLTINGQQVTLDSKKIQRTMTDAEFMTTFNKIQRRIRDKVKAPLINSGFIVEVIGGGMLQLSDVYDVGDDDRGIDYDIKKYKTMLEAIASPQPRMSTSEVPKLFYWGDYQILSWAFVCATIDKIEHMVECLKDRSKAFRITGSPIDLLDMDETFQQRLVALEALTHKNSVESLVDRTNVFEDSHGSKITLRHPNYKYGNKTLKDIKALAKAPDVADDIKNLLNRPLIREMMLYLDEINVYGQFLADTLLKKLYYLRSMNEKDLTTLGEVAAAMEEEAYRYKFTFRDIPCPFCGENHTYTIGDIDGMVFQSRRLMFMLSMIERKQKLSGENTEGKNSNSTNE